MTSAEASRISGLEGVGGGERTRAVVVFVVASSKSPMDFSSTRTIGSFPGGV